MAARYLSIILQIVLIHEALSVPYSLQLGTNDLNARNNLGTDSFAPNFSNLLSNNLQSQSNIGVSTNTGAFTSLGNNGITSMKGTVSLSPNLQGPIGSSIQLNAGYSDNPSLQFGDLSLNGDLPIGGTIKVCGCFPVYGSISVDGNLPTSGTAGVAPGFLNTNTVSNLM